jgi:hypothetical protein
MALGLNFKVQGGDELRRKLAGLKRSAANRIFRKGFGQAATIVLQGARKRVPQRTRRLKRALGKKVKSYRQGVGAVALVGPRRGYGKEINGKLVNPTRYAHLAERDRPYLGPAAREAEPKIAAILARVGKEEVEKLAR